MPFASIEGQRRVRILARFKLSTGVLRGSDVFYYTAKHPIHACIRQIFDSREVQSELSKLDIAPEQVEKIVLGIFEDMGLYEVQPGDHILFLQKLVMEWLKTAPEIVMLDRKLKIEAAKRRERDRRRG